MKELIVRNEITIEAPVAKVWEVLIAPKFIRQWDFLPEDFPDYYLEVGVEITWSGSSKMTVTEMLPHESLKLSMYISKWELPPSAYDIGYHYRLSGENDTTKLSLEVGDFGALQDGQDYYQTSIDFSERALSKIKAIAENRV